jgi:hypothetical protein
MTHATKPTDFLMFNFNENKTATDHNNESIQKAMQEQRQLSTSRKQNEWNNTQGRHSKCDNLTDNRCTVVYASGVASGRGGGGAASAGGKGAGAVPRALRGGAAPPEPRAVGGAETDGGAASSASASASVALEAAAMGWGQRSMSMLRLTSSGAAEGNSRTRMNIQK